MGATAKSGNPGFLTERWIALFIPGSRFRVRSCLLRGTVHVAIPRHETANPSIERACSGKPGQASHLKLMTDARPEFPQRIFLDSSVLQTMLRYGEFLYDGGLIEPHDRIHRDPNGLAKLEALQAIMEVGRRASFQFALSKNSFSEVTHAARSSYLSWAYDVLDHWNACLEESDPPIPNDEALRMLDSGQVGYLGNGDRALIRDAILFECDTFLTMENKLPKNRPHLRKCLGLWVETPEMVWSRVQPWAGLFL
jgi:hypothetical protein